MKLNGRTKMAGLKSPQVEHAGPDSEGSYSGLQVLHSNAGWYIGTLFTGSDGFIEPGSRDSGYFCTEVEAAAELRVWETEGICNNRETP